MLLVEVTNLALLGSIILCIAAVLAPFESINWWTGWFNSNAEDDSDDVGYLLRIDAPETEITSEDYIVFLDGISRASRENNVTRTADFITVLSNSFPNSVIISDIFPYSPQGKALTENRLMSRFWNILDDSNSKSFWRRFRVLINLRNMLQVMVSSDRRYGPVFNQGAANNVIRALLNAGYKVNSGRKIILIGYSGGGQISVGIAPFLKATLKAPLTLISVGGIFGGNTSLLAFDKIYHLLGSQDTATRRGLFVFPRRWKTMKTSIWNSLQENKTVEVIDLDGVKHNGSDSYFDSYESQNLDISLSIIISLIIDSRVRETDFHRV